MLNPSQIRVIIEADAKVNKQWFDHDSAIEYRAAHSELVEALAHAPKQIRELLDLVQNMYRGLLETECYLIGVPADMDIINDAKIAALPVVEIFHA